MAGDTELELHDVYYTCKQCHGLLPANPDSSKQQQHSHEHLAHCDGSIANSPCLLFAVDKDTFLGVYYRKFAAKRGKVLKSTKKRKLMQIVPDEHVKKEDSEGVFSNDSKDSVFSVEKRFKHETNFDIGSRNSPADGLNGSRTTIDCKNMPSDIESGDMDETKTILSDANPHEISNTPETLPVDSKSTESDLLIRKSRRISDKHKLVSDNIPSTNNESIYVKFEDIDKMEGTESGDECKDNTSKKILNTKSWMKQRAELEEQYSGYVVSLKEAVGKRSKLQYATNCKTYQCTQCEWNTTHVGHFHRHTMHNHHTNGMFTCELCDFTCTEARQFRRHKNKHELPFICEFCSQRFAFKKDVERHSWKHTNTQPFQCSQCDYKSRFKESLDTHKRKHTGEKLTCPEENCQFTTIHQTALRLHKQRQHHGDNQKIYQCDTCKFITPCHTNMKTHIKRHQDDRNFLCSMCSYRGVTRQEVLRHMNTHYKEKDYSCDQCDYASGHRTTFKTHMMRHNGARPFQCSICGYRSITKQKVIRHIMHKSECAEANILHKPFQLDLNKYKVRASTSVTENISSDTPALEVLCEYLSEDGNVVIDSAVNELGSASVPIGEQVEVQYVNTPALNEHQYFSTSVPSEQNYVSASALGGQQGVSADVSHDEQLGTKVISHLSGIVANVPTVEINADSSVLNADLMTEVEVVSQDEIMDIVSGEEAVNNIPQEI